MSILAADLIRTYGPLEPIYSWCNDKTGEQLDLAAERLRLFTLEPSSKLEVAYAPVEYSRAIEMWHNKSIDLHHVLQLKARKKLDPIIFIEFADGTHQLVDGHHRYALIALSGLDMIPAFVLKPKEWEPFRIIGLKKLTEKQLADTPLISEILR